MKLKELHIRNIASIERADVDFENGLNDTATGLPASIFLISGDTGAGKSVILDGIAMALYKKTPRIADVANASRNDYTDSEGEQIRVASIEQYTRLGISEKDESYSEVVFEGNDGETYHARLTLGMRLGQRDKETGKRPLKHRPPRWEVKVGEGDWTKDSVEQTIFKAVGLDFQQFGRMAMLAQGQFAHFLTGDKKEREAILEQLTNTQHFTAYGEAIQSLWKKAKADQERIQTQYDTEKPHTLTDEEVELLTKEQQEDQQQRERLDHIIKVFDHRLKLTETVLANETVQAEARQRKQQLEAVIAGEEYQRSKTLFTEWDATTEQRRQMADLQRAQREAQVATDSLLKSRDTFAALTADIAARQAQVKLIDDTIGQTKAWIERRQQHEALFARAGEADLKIGQYLEKEKKAQLLAATLREEKEKTGSLLKAEAEAQTRAQAADKALKDKEAEIEMLCRRRESLHPQAVNEQIMQKEAAKRQTEDMRKAYEAWEKARKETDALCKEIETEKKTLETLRESSEKADAVYQVRKVEAEKANRRLTTMRMSVNDTIVALRHRLIDEHTDTCPLCGQHIDHDHLDDDFQGILTPLENEQRTAAQVLEQATRQRNDARDAFVKFHGAHQEKTMRADADRRRDAQEKEAINVRAAMAGFNIGEQFAEQMENALRTLAEDIALLTATQREAEALQRKANALLKDKKPLDKEKLDAERTKTKAENSVRGNAESIQRIERELQEALQECGDLKTEVSAMLAGYCDSWQACPDAVRTQLKSDAKEFSVYQKRLTDFLAKKEKDETLINSLRQFARNILDACPDWASCPSPQPPSLEGMGLSSGCTAAWTALIGKVTALVAKKNECNHLIAASKKALSDHYQQTGRTEQQLVTLMAQEQDVATARRFVGDTDSQLKSRIDAIADAQRQIDAALLSLSVGERASLPDKQVLETERAAAVAQRDDLLAKMAQTRSRLEMHRANAYRLKEMERLLEEAKRRFVRWDQLNRIFGGTRFRTLVQTYILRPLLNNANIYLQQITDRYRLTCSEDNEQLSILVHDRYNKDQVRSVTVLSGGERFMLSLALSLALSSLNRPDMNVNILFIDEGFGTLDEKSLDSVMSTLEKLQEIAGQSDRRVGIISHREELDERIPVQIRVVKRGEGRSQVDCHC